MKYGSIKIERLECILCFSSTQADHAFGCPFGAITHPERMIFVIKICRPYIRLQDGKTIYARDYGLKAFCFEVTEEEHAAYWRKKGKEPPKR